MSDAHTILDISDWPHEWQPHWPPGTTYGNSLNTVTVTTEDDILRVAALANLPPSPPVKTSRGFAECAHAAMHFHGTDPPTIEIKWLPRIVRPADWPGPRTTRRE